MANRSPPMPLDIGATRPIIALAATAASTAFPPRSSMCTPACAASGDSAATMPLREITIDRPWLRSCASAPDVPLYAPAVTTMAPASRATAIRAWILCEGLILRMARRLLWNSHANVEPTVTQSHYWCNYKPFKAGMPILCQDLGPKAWQHSLQTSGPMLRPGFRRWKVEDSLLSCSSQPLGLRLWH